MQIFHGFGGRASGRRRRPKVILQLIRVGIQVFVRYFGNVVFTFPINVNDNFFSSWSFC